MTTNTLTQLQVAINQLTALLEQARKEVTELQKATPAESRISPDALVRLEKETSHSSNPFLKPPCLQRNSPHKSSRNGVKIRYIVLHCTEGSAQSADAEFMGGSRMVSAHYLVDRSGRITQYVPDAERANHCRGANEYSIGIECVGGEDDPLAEAQALALAKLLAWLCWQYSIALNKIYGHDFAPHYNGGGTSCPDKLFGPRHDQATVEKWVMDNVQPIMLTNNSQTL